jgi:hypothetical protein
MKKRGSTQGRPASELIDGRIAELADWRGGTLSRMRELIRAADPDVVEEWKWMGTPVWSHDGIVCTGETYTSVVKLTFAKGASLADPGRLFNSSLDGNTRRAIDIREGEQVDADAFQSLVRAAVALNASGGKTRSRPASPRRPGAGVRERASVPAAKPSKSRRAAAKNPALLGGGNPQVAKADGDAPVRAYIAAMPGWKRDVGRRLDALIERTVPGVRRAVKWNSPFYGVEGRGWFLSVHCFSKYVKVAFFRGASLRPLPPGTSTQKEVRYLDIREDDEIDEKVLASWIRQASKLPGFAP